MSLTLFKLNSAIIIFLFAILGGIWPFLKKKNALEAVSFDFPSGEALASGIFLGASLLHMLPYSAHIFASQGYHYPLAFLLAAISFLFFLLLEHLSVAIQHKAHYLLMSMIWITILMFSIHSFLEGTAMGITASYTAAFMLFFAIIAHKSAASFALAVYLNQRKLKFINSIILFAFFALMTPVGIFVGSWFLLANKTLLVPIFSSLAAGTFLYIGTLHGLERASLIRHCCNMKEFSLMLLGFGMMAIVAMWA